MNVSRTLLGVVLFCSIPSNHVHAGFVVSQGPLIVEFLENEIPDTRTIHVYVTVPEGSQLLGIYASESSIEINLLDPVCLSQ